MKIVDCEVSHVEVEDTVEPFYIRRISSKMNH